jgi:signal transduction histidine kinase/ActR/RegA family two-component response regulator
MPYALNSQLQAQRLAKIRTLIPVALPNGNEKPNMARVEQIRRALSEMRTEERATLDSQLDGFETVRLKIQNEVLGLVVLGGCFLAAGLVAFIGGIKRLRRTQKALETANADLRIARGEAIAASEAKGRFLADMSHEIRTPLSGIVGMASLLSESELSPKNREIIRTIKASSDVLLRAVNDVLDLSKIQAGRLELLPEPFDLRKVVQDVASLYRGAAAEVNDELRITVPDEPCWVEADPVRVKQVVGNLVNNAVKFCHDGIVEVSLAHGLAHGYVLRVRDTGIGMRAEQLDILFDDYVQGDPTISGKYGGTGLGLAIVRQLVERMGGEIHVQSEPGEGSIFEVELPLPASHPPTVELSQPDSANMHVLLAEDNEVNILVAQALLERAGCFVEVARDGAAAIEMAATGDYDAILMDHRLPLCDGPDAARAIVNAFEGREHRPRIIAMTADVTDETRSACLDAGMDDFLEKPFTYESLVSSLKGSYATTN